MSPRHRGGIYLPGLLRWFPQLLLPVEQLLHCKWWWHSLLKTSQRFLLHLTSKLWSSCLSSFSGLIPSSAFPCLLCSHQPNGLSLWSRFLGSFHWLELLWNILETTPNVFSAFLASQVMEMTSYPPCNHIHPLHQFSVCHVITWLTLLVLLLWNLNFSASLWSLVPAWYLASTPLLQCESSTGHLWVLFQLNQQVSVFFPPLLARFSTAHAEQALPQNHIFSLASPSWASG